MKPRPCVTGRSNKPGTARYSLASLLGLALLLSGCANDLERVKEVTALPGVQAETGRNVEIHYTDEGRLKAKIMAPELLQNHDQKEPYTEFAKGLKLYFYSPEGEIDSKLSANYGKSFTKKNEMIVRDDVVIVNTKGEKLNTEELIWKQEDKRIYSEKFVKITTPDEIIYGNGFEANEDFSDYQIKDIKGVISVEADDLEEDF